MQVWGVVDASIYPMVTDGHPQVILCVSLDLCYPGLMPMSIVWISGRGLHGGKTKAADMTKETGTLLEAGVIPIMAGDREMKLWLASESYHYTSQTGDGHLLGSESETT